MEHKELMCLLIFAFIVVLIVIITHELQKKKESITENFPLNMYMLLDLTATIKEDKRDKSLFKIIVEDIFNIDLKSNCITDSDLYNLEKEFIGSSIYANSKTSVIIRAILETKEDESTVHNIKKILKCFKDILEKDCAGNFYLENNKLKYEKYVD